ncbi:MAG TPA: DUF3307 domain-containing protein [Candidatus Binatia bacterium]|jgi:hypothetical protein|nr:DUF3307 domain-containing protein [Candidatus Binatia bacterium]
MFWTLGLAHLIGDYPLQTDRMVRAKRHWPGLTLHVAIHFAVMLLLTGRDSLVVWPPLLMLAAAHFAIDSFKNLETVRWPQMVLPPYFVDQLLHILSIFLVARWIETRYGIYRDQPWMIYAAAYLSATHVWFITERIVAYRDAAYRKHIESHYLARVGVRALALTVYLLLGRQVWLAVAAPAMATALLPEPYRCSSYCRLMLLQDVLGPLVLAILVFLLSP